MQIAFQLMCQIKLEKFITLQLVCDGVDAEVDTIEIKGFIIKPFSPLGFGFPFVSCHT